MLLVLPLGMLDEDTEAVLEEFEASGAAVSEDLLDVVSEEEGEEPVAGQGATAEEGDGLAAAASTATAEAPLERASGLASQITTAATASMRGAVCVGGQAGVGWAPMPSAGRVPTLVRAAGVFGA